MRLAKLILTAVAALTVGAFAPAPAGASAIAFDSAGDSAYNNGAAFPASGGYGWVGGWNGDVSGNGGGVLLVGSSSANGDGDPGGTGDVNSPRSPLGRAWGFTDALRGGRLNGIGRSFSGALSVGQTFAIDFDPGRIVFNYNEAVVFDGPAVEASSSSKDYLFAQGWYFDAGGLIIDSGVPISSRGAHIEVTPLDGSSVLLSVTSLADGTTGSAVLPYSQIASVAIFNQNPPSPPYDGDDDVYFNNISITPEPASSAVVLLISAGLLRRARRGARWVGSYTDAGNHVVQVYKTSDSGIYTVYT